MIISLRSVPFLVLLNVISGATWAQDLAPSPKRTIEAQILGTAKDTIYLANYYGNKLYYADTAVADAKGRIVFNDPKGYPSGVYAIVTPGPKLFEVIVNEPLIKLTSDTVDLLGRLQVITSNENDLFIGYIRFLNDQKLAADALRAKQASADPIGKATLQKQLEDLDVGVKAYQKELVETNQGTLVSSLVKMSMTVELPEPKKDDGSLDSAEAYYQYRAHYWDNFDLTDDRIVRIPVFANKFDEYFSKAIPQVPDTINRIADALIARTGNSKEVFKYMVHSITYKYETSDIMGMDAVFAHMALTYYCPEPTKATWMSEDKLEKLCERANKIAPLTLGRKAANIILTDTTEQNWINMYDLPAEYILIVFWDPHCGVCKKELPEIKEAYDAELKDLGVEVFCVAKAVDDGLMKDWKKFIREHDLNWVNVGLTKSVYEEAKKDPRKFIPKLTTIESLNYSDTYDVYSTPKIFLVDADRKFIGKQLSPEQVGDLVRNKRARAGKS